MNKSAVKAKYVFGQLTLEDIMPMFEETSLIYCHKKNTPYYTAKVYGWYVEKIRTWSQITSDGDYETETEELRNPELHLTDGFINMNRTNGQGRKSLQHLADQEQEGPIFLFDQPVKVKRNEIEIGEYVLTVYWDLNLEQIIQKIDD